MTTTRCKCGTVSNYGMTCVRCRQEVRRSGYKPTPKEPAEPTPVEEPEEEEETED